MEDKEGHIVLAKEGKESRRTKGSKEDGKGRKVARVKEW